MRIFEFFIFKISILLLAEVANYHKIWQSMSNSQNIHQKSFGDIGRKISEKKSTIWNSSQGKNVNLVQFTDFLGKLSF
jgi:hypothetical protein